MEQRIGYLLLITSIIFLESCSKDDNSGHSDAPIELRTDFNDGKDGWQADFSEYHADHVASYELEEGLETLPAPLDEQQQAYRISAMNRSDDLFMYLTRKITDLQPLTTYKSQITVDRKSTRLNSSHVKISYAVFCLKKKKTKTKKKYI